MKREVWAYSNSFGRDNESLPHVLHHPYCKQSSPWRRCGSNFRNFGIFKLILHIDILLTLSIKLLALASECRTPPSMISQLSIVLDNDITRSQCVKMTVHGDHYYLHYILSFERGRCVIFQPATIRTLYVEDNGLIVD